MSYFIPIAIEKSRCFVAIKHPISHVKYNKCTLPKVQVKALMHHKAMAKQCKKNMYMKKMCDFFELNYLIC